MVAGARWQQSSRPICALQSNSGWQMGDGERRDGKQAYVVWCGVVWCGRGGVRAACICCQCVCVFTFRCVHLHSMRTSSSGTRQGINFQETVDAGAYAECFAVPRAVLCPKSKGKFETGYPYTATLAFVAGPNAGARGSSKGKNPCHPHTVAIDCTAQPLPWLGSCLMTECSLLKLHMHILTAGTAYCTACTALH